jgi:hypothetical protein
LLIFPFFYFRRGIRRGFLSAESARSPAGPALRRMMRTFFALLLENFSFRLLRFHVSFFIFIAAFAAFSFTGLASRLITGR